MKRYCLNCGSPTEYTLKKPTFCANCGNSFNQENNVNAQNLQVSKPINIKNNIKKLEVDFDDDSESDSQQMPNISKLQVETETQAFNKAIKLKDLMGTDLNSRKEKKKVKGRKVSKKQVLEDFAKEAGSLRKNKR